MTADRGGQADLLPATACAVNMTLTYQIRPVEDLALQLKFLLAGTSAGAGDTLDITGTDWRGAAQVESINVAAGNGTYVGTKHWRTITDIDCTGWADGTLRVTQPRWGVIWDKGNRQYQVDSYFHVGGGGVPTYFQDKSIQLVLADGWVTATWITVVANATFILGALIDAIDKTTKEGCAIFSVEDSTTIKLIDSVGTAYLYSCQFTCQRAARLSDMDRIYNCVASKNVFLNCVNVSTDIENFIVQDDYYTNLFRTQNLEISNLHSQGCRYGFWFWNAGTVNLYNSTTIGILDNDLVFQDATGTKNLINCEIEDWTNILWLGTSTADIYRKYTCNIHIADKDGTNLANATILCEDKDGNEIFSVLTDANGDIAEQQIPYADMIASATPWVVRSPHKFTISKAGYETLVEDDKTIDDHIVWDFELLPALAESDVRDGVIFGEDGEGDLEVPSEDDVEDGVGFGSNGVEFEGNFEVPAEEDVEVGVDYGAGGVEFEGTYLGLTGNNLVGYLQKSVELVGYLQKSVALVGYLEKKVTLVGYLEKKVTLTGTLQKSVTLTGELTS